MRCSSYHATVCLLLTFASSMPLLFLGCGGEEEAVENDPYAGSIFIGDRAAQGDHCSCPDGAICSGCPPNIQVGGANLSFDNEDGMIEGRLRIINSGKGNLRLSNITIEGNAAEVIQFESSSEINGQAMADLTSEPPVPVYIAPDSALDLEFRWDGGEDISGTTFVIRSNDSDSLETRVPLSLLLPKPSCEMFALGAKLAGSNNTLAPSIDVSPTQTVELGIAAAPHALARVDRFEWFFHEMPAGSTARFVSSPNVLSPMFFVDREGQFVAGLEVILDNGEVFEGCEDWEVVINAVAQPEPTNNQTTEPEPACVDVLAVASVRGEDAPPASELEVPPLSTLEFEVQASDDVLERIERFEWSIIKAPEGSTARLTPNNTAPRPSLFIDIVGGYTIELIAVIGDSSDVLEFCNEQKVEVYAVPCDPCGD